MKKRIWIIYVMMFGILTSMTAFAGEWRKGAAPYEDRWWFANDDGTYAVNGWYWLDGNKDGIGECYYFDAGGYMLSGTITPDGYTVNQDGGWTDLGVVMTKNVLMNNEAEANMISVLIQVGDRQFELSLLNNASTQALVAQMPMTIDMGEMNGNEKYFYLPSSLPSDTQSVGNIHTGDLMLYGSDCLVLFYQDFSTSYQYTKLGTVSNPVGLAEALGRGSVKVSFRLKTS